MDRWVEGLVLIIGKVFTREEVVIVSISCKVSNQVFKEVGNYVCE